MNKLIIIGASGHGKVVADIALKNGYKDIAFLDDNANIKECAGFPVIGKTTDYTDYKDCDFIVAIGNSQTRERIQGSLEGYHIVTLIHPNAIISRRVTIGEGSVIAAGTVINSDTTIGKGCIINTCASVDHDNTIGNYVHVAVSAHMCGTVQIGDDTWIGAGATISNNINVCGNCIIAAGAVVTKSIDSPGKYGGIPAKVLY